jgi:hypothetical protein
MRKLMIVPWVGPLPDWIGMWLENVMHVADAGHGWQFLLDVDEAMIRDRIEGLGVTCPPLKGRKLCDYRPAFGEMYAEEVKGFDFWGHTDLDCVYGKLWDYVSDDLLADADIYSNDPAPQMCGPFSLYRTATASSIFRSHPDWQAIFENPEHLAFDETGIAPTIADSDLRVVHDHFEGWDSMYVHFTSDKEYPLHLPAGFLP